jgi:dolichol-phosphate mannosyltransferase
MQTNIKLSIVSPVFGCRDSLQSLYTRLVDTISTITNDFEIIFVNDACPHNSWDVITKLCMQDTRVKGINLSRNFGQHHAITAGLDHVSGEWIVVMDCDLQDQPEEIPKLYRKALEGYDIVFGKRVDRQDKYFKIITSRVFRYIFNYLSGVKKDASEANFGIFSRKVIDSVSLYREQYRGFPVMVSSVGFRKIAVPVNHAPREQGESGYNISKLITLAVDAIVAHSNKPLRISIKLGFLLSVASMIYTIWLILRYFIHDITVAGWTSTMVLLLFMFGILFALLGIVGLYVGKVFDETKARPLYIISDTHNLPNRHQDTP